MTLSAHTLTLVALIAIGLSLLAIGFVVFAAAPGAGGLPASSPATMRSVRSSGRSNDSSKRFAR